ncbi:MAG TPA: prephenate dehydratase [Syntrophaceae bacterium]|nr:prephenate dehydratase [Syntrophaceae bacterium]
MGKIEKLRDEIDATDEEILRLLNKRQNLADRIGKIKKKKGLDLLDPIRELEIYERLSRLNKGPLTDAALKNIFREIISAARQVQKPISVAYLGPAATFTHLAAVNYFGRSAKLVPQASMKDVFLEVEKGNCDYGVVPVENSTEGTISYTLDLLYHSTSEVCGEIYLKISHNLVSLREGKEGIQKVYSHPQALAQCREWLKKNLPHASLVDVTSTASAAELATHDPESAAITSEFAATIYNLRILEKGIEDHSRNLTRFLIMGKKFPPKSGFDKTSLLFSTDDVPGALYQVLGPIAKRGINLTKIESRPMKTEPWKYVFFVDMEGHIEDKPIREAIEELKGKCTYLKHLGSYPRAEQND